MTERHPDIEIYIKNCNQEQIKNWLLQHSSSLKHLSSKNNIHEYQANFTEGSVEIMLHEKVAGKAWSSLWFKTNPTPWLKDLDCAHTAAKELETQIRCIASGWQDGDDPDEWWKVENGEEELIQWRT